MLHRAKFLKVKGINNRQLKERKKVTHHDLDLKESFE